MKTKTRAAGGWLAARMQSAEFRKSYERHSLAENFIGDIEDVMRREGMTRSQLAEKMGCKPSNVTRAMRLTTNMTIATMVDMAFVLGYRIRVWLQPITVSDCSGSVPGAMGKTDWQQQINSTIREEGDISLPSNTTEGAPCGAPTWNINLESISQAGARQTSPMWN